MKLQLLTVFSLLQLSAGNPRLDCQETVETRIGDNVTLTCHMEPEEIIGHEELEVTKVEPAALVYFYHNGKQFADFYEPYRHRTFLNTEELKSGVVNLKIFPVRQSDNGTYRIYISNRRITTLVTLIVENPLLVCQETVEARISDNVTLTCQLEPKQNIENETISCRRADSSQLVYTYSNRKQLPDQEDQYRHRTSLDFEDLKIGVLRLNIFSVRKSDNGTFIIYISKWGISSTVTLIVEPADLKKTERQNSSSAETSVTGVPPPSDDPPSRDRRGVVIGVPVALAVALIALVVALVAIVLILVKHKVIGRCWTRMMMKMRDPKRQHDDEDQRRVAVNYHLPPAEKEIMMELEL